MAGQDLSIEFLKCRTWGHPWQEYHPSDWSPPPYGWRESLRCTRCSAERHRLIDRKGAVMTVSYVYPNGYLRPHGSGTLLRGALRVEVFARLRSKLEAAQAVSANYDSPILVGRKSKKAS